MSTSIRTRIRRTEAGNQLGTLNAARIKRAQVIKVLGAPNIVHNERTELENEPSMH